MDIPDNLIENRLKTRFYLDSIPLVKDKISFVINLSFVISKEPILIYLKFWEKKKYLVKSLELEGEKHEIVSEYFNHEMPGLCKIHLIDNQKDLLERILNCHFNFELGFEPYLNVRPYFLLKSSTPTILDIYDDRGFDLYSLNNSPDVESL